MDKSYNNSVFINCPFDDGYKDMLYAIIFCVYRCGFSPRSSLEEHNALTNRLSKIEHIIEECRFGIHDLSRTEINENALPRFNMAFELGIFFGAKRFGNDEQKNKIALVLEKQKFLYQQYISDLSGVDTVAHDNDIYKAIKIVRDWLHSSSGRKTVNGPLTIIKDYNNFINSVLPGVARKSGLDINDITFNDYCLIVEASMMPYLD